MSTFRSYSSSTAGSGSFPDCALFLCQLLGDEVVQMMPSAAWWVNPLHLQVGSLNNFCLLACSSVARGEEPEKHMICIPAPPLTQEKVWMLVDQPCCSARHGWTPTGQERRGNSCQTRPQPRVACGFQGTDIGCPTLGFSSRFHQSPLEAKPVPGDRVGLGPVVGLC